MISKRLGTILLPYSILFFLFNGGLLTGCKEKAPTDQETPRGRFVDKIFFINKDYSQNSSVITIADLYNDNGILKLYNRRELTEGVGAEISEDRTWIVYIRLNGLRPMRINVDGTDKRAIPFPADLVVQEINISPDGSMLAVGFHKIGDNYDGRHIGVMCTNGEEFRTVYADSGWSFVPDWSSDGKKLYFAWTDLNNRFGHNMSGSFRVKAYIISVNLDGTNWQPISDTFSGLSNDSYPVVSPDGSQIAFTSQRNYPENIFPEVFIMNINGTNIRQLTQCRGCQRHGDHFDNYTMDGTLLWTKDGKHIIFQRTTHTYDHDLRQYTQQNDLFIINPDGTGMQNLTNDGKSALKKAAGK